MVRYGTAARAMSLGRKDLAGKTGTTNDLVDAWFAGYQPGIVAISWMGFDQPRKLGSNETGAVAALPIWIDYMGKALKDVPEVFMPVPQGIVSTRVNAAGQRTNEGGRAEFFFLENVPAETPAEPPSKPPEESRPTVF